MVDGPWAEMSCPHCHTKTDISDVWKHVVRLAMEQKNRFEPVVRVDLNSPYPHLRFAAASGIRPVCPSCGQHLKKVTNAIQDGTDEDFPCPKCGVLLPTWPAPPYLRRAAVIQVFLGLREAEQGRETTDETVRPVMFDCTNCGAPAKVTTESPRIISCEFCEVDLFLPQSLWSRMHPVRTRRAFWLRCD